MKRKFNNFKKKLILFFSKSKEYAKPLDLYHMQKVIIKTYDAYGDLIITTPVFRELKQNYPHLVIDVLVSPKNKDLLINNPYINKIYVNTLKGNINDYIQIFKLRNNKYDLAIDLWGRISLSLIVRFRLINAKNYIALSTESSFRPKYQLGTENLQFYNYTFGKDLLQHQRDRFLDLFNLLNISITSKEYDVYTTTNHNLLKFFNQNNSKIYIAVIYHGSGIHNTLNKENVIKMIKPSLNKQRIFFILHEEKYKNEAFDIVKEINHDNVILAPLFRSFLEYCYFLKQCNIIITTGTSALHIASAFNKKIIAIYPNTQFYNNFAPVSKNEQKIIYPHSTEDVNNFDTNLISKYLSLMEKEII